eukprot:8033456-Lingulodinium_polyedra.AAC.1
MERASVRFASRRSGETQIRAHHGAAFRKRCAMTRSNQRFLAAVRKIARPRYMRGPKTDPR